MSFDGMLVFDDTELDFDVDAEVLCTQESDDVTATVEYGSSVSLDEGQDEERDDDESSTENVEEDLRYAVFVNDVPEMLSGSLCQNDHHSST